jgi:pyruvate/2-oxoglutarate dehydrogenase complex dihydrolipoamide dehydrogenase (E3) component
MGSEEPYDLLVIGGGSAGSAAAAEAVKQGLRRVLVVNDGELGGLCILRGCMPTKTLLATTDLLHDMLHGPELGVQVERPRVDFGAVMARKRRLVERFQRSKVAAMQAAGYELVDGRARFVGPDAVEIDGRRVTAKTFVIATGSRLHVPPVPDLEEVDYLHSDVLLELEAPPRSLLIQGSGAVGLEYATFFSGLGVPVTLLSRSALVNRGEDPELSRHMENVLKACGVTVHTGAVVEHFERIEGGLRAHVRRGTEHFTTEAERYLLALGREANLEGLDLAQAGIESDGTKLVLDTCLATTNPRVFAAGDATDERQILHTGNMEGRHVARNAARLIAGQPLEAWVEEVPLFAVFTHPPYAECGLNETRARTAGLDVVSAHKEWANQGRGIVMGATPGAGCAKLIAERGTGRLVGAQLLGPRADDLIHVPATLMHFRGTVKDLVAMPWYHPTLSEMFIELGRELDRLTSA